MVRRRIALPRSAGKLIQRIPTVRVPHRPRSGAVARGLEISVACPSQRHDGVIDEQS